jgi:Domain of unknown function (DUF4331)
MKKVLFSLAASMAIAFGIYLIAADHNDSALLTGASEDITDVYAFQGENTNNLVLVCNTKGLLSPTTTAATTFDPNKMFEFNIDNTGDNVEDLVIQCYFKGNKMIVYGPIKPTATGTMSTLMTSAPKTEVDVTSYTDSKAGNIKSATGSNGLKAFAGPRDDPFFFDLNQFKKIIGGTATGFNDPGVDTFAGTNVMSIVVELPKTLLNPPASNTINVWAESKKKI